MDRTEDVRFTFHTPEEEVRYWLETDFADGVLLEGEVADAFIITFVSSKTVTYEPAQPARHAEEIFSLGEDYFLLHEFPFDPDEHPQPDYSVEIVKHFQQHFRGRDGATLDSNLHLLLRSHLKRQP